MERLLERVRAQYPSADLTMVAKAFEYAKRAHSGQERASGEPYFSHPYEVANILMDMELDIPTIVAALLHDVIEDTECTYEDIEKEFSPEVAMLVDSVTKLSRMEFRSREEQQAESLRKMMLAMARDIRVILIKLADRLHNMRTLQFRPPEKRVSTAKETLEIYAPLAHRLGMSRIQWELEDLSFQYIAPEEYRQLADNVMLHYTGRMNNIQHAIAVIRQKLDENHIEAEIEGRPKHFYSIYKKMQQQGKTLDEVFDLVAIRVIVNTEQDCYAVLGIVHTLWRPIPGRFKDYIANPKLNLYQSLHTTLIGETGHPFEIQIRTFEMHRTAEFGIAAHWQYKEGTSGDEEMNQKLSWLRQILEWQNDEMNAQEFVDTMKIDLFSDEVFVFTPKGDVVNLPAGSTPVDFAYHIHSAIGNKCTGAKINQRIVTLDTPLKTGDIVEIMTSANSKGPSLDWLKFVRTSQAKNRIRAWLKKEFKEENIEKGRETLEKEARRQGIPLAKLMRPEWLEPIYQRYSLRTVEDIYAAVGFGGLTTNQVLVRLLEEYRKERKQELLQRQLEELSEPYTQEERVQQAEKARSGQIVSVKGEKNMLVRFAHCCNPVPGDDIVGYVTRGRGVSVHRADCVNLQDMPDIAERMIEVAWEKDMAESFHTDLQIVAHDLPGLLALIVKHLAEMDVELVSINVRSAKNGTAVIRCTIEVVNTQQVDRIIRTFSKMPEIIDAQRSS